MKLQLIIASFALLMVTEANAQAKPKGLIVEVYGKKGVFKKDEFLACEKTYADDMKNKCNEKEGQVNTDISVVEAGGCFDQVAQARDVCQGKAFVGNVGDAAVAGYETEVYKEPVSAKPKDKEGSTAGSDDMLD